VTERVCWPITALKRAAAAQGWLAERRLRSTGRTLSNVIPARTRYDVVVAGASIAGCAAARLYALAGARVALIERRPDPAAYKVACTHQIQSSAVPAIERLGLAPLLERAGAVRSRAATWTPFGGWLQFPLDAPPGYGITRRSLDPILRELAVATPGVEYLPGQAVVGLAGDPNRVEGVEVENTDHRRRKLSARLTVAADGRDSTTARLAQVPARVRPHNRFVYFAYWRGVRSPKSEARLWLLDPDAAAVFPNEDDVTVIVTVPHRRRIAEFRAAPEAAYSRALDGLPDGPGLDGAERVSKLIGKFEMPNRMRPAAASRIAFIGDAALATDPLFGVGCGWAFQSAAWLVDETSSALLQGGDLDRALKRYRRAFRRRLGLHHFQIADYSTGRPMRLNERIALRAAANDPVVGSVIEEVATRRRTVLRLLDPRLTPRMLRGRPWSPLA
jgi:2-polyprenyl-6-methoxyphenol hydroxylase-like FAD-dependent oxidoreductase